VQRRKPRRRRCRQRGAKFFFLLSSRGNFLTRSVGKFIEGPCVTCLRHHSHLWKRTQGPSTCSHRLRLVFQSRAALGMTPLFWGKAIAIFDPRRIESSLTPCLPVFRQEN
jgi:hypothetical protein